MQLEEDNRGVNVVISDSTAYKREIRLFNAINHSSDSIIISDIDARIIEVNEATLRMHGVEDRDEVIGKDFFRFIVPEEQEEALESISNAVMGKGHVISREHTIVTRAGKRVPVDMSIALVKDKDNKLLGLVCILRDITERKKMKERERAHLEELERANKELDDYTYAVAHDLKTPLRATTSFSDLLLKEYSDKLDENGRNYLKRIRKASIRMAELIKDILIFSQFGKRGEKKEEVALNKLLEKIKSSIETDLKKKKVEIHICELPKINTLKEKMKQLFEELINNGLKFNESPNPRIWIKCEERKDHYIFSVKDNGIGIDEKHHDKIFKIFQRLHTVNEYPGTGAGLTMCKKIVESMGGTISLDSKLGKGSTFYFTHPNEKKDDSYTLRNKTHTNDPIQKIEDSLF